MLARLGGGLRHGMLPGLALCGADTCPPANRYPPGSRPGQAFAGNAAVAFFMPTFVRGIQEALCRRHGFAHRRAGTLPHCAIRIFFSSTRRPHFAMSAARTARKSALAPLLISMLSASSLLLTSGAASACLMAASIVSRIAFGVPAGANAPIQVATS